ncbi:MAG: FkbM family methyltransferase [Terriglobales bacterium]|jgi:FkbM family methyltransferase
MTTLLNYSKLTLVRATSAARRALIGRHVDALLVRGERGIFLVDVEDMSVGWRLAHDGQYGDAELERLLSVVTEQSTVLMVGTHVGTLAVPAAKHCRQLIAIEANPRTFQLLQENLLLNGCHNVRALNIAAGDRQEEIQFVLSRTNSGGAKRMPQVRDYAYFYDSPEVTSVASHPLDEVLGDAAIDVILMDIEGSEYSALGGMQRILSRASVLFMEFIPHHLRNVAGVSVDQLLALIRPHFSTLFVPSQNLCVGRDQFGDVLQTMFGREESDDGIVFRK